MTKESIRERFNKNGYRMVCICGGAVIITPPSGFQRRFYSANEAYRFYFKNN